MRTLLVTCLTAIVALAGCRRESVSPSSGSVRNVITQAQIEASDAPSVYDLVLKLRADFFRDRGRVSINTTNQRDRPVVFINGQEYGVIETLRNIPPNRFSEIRFYPGTEAAARFGSQYGGGVIHLTSRSS